jgi:hypothetical protein
VTGGRFFCHGYLQQVTWLGEGLVLSDYQTLSVGKAAPAQWHQESEGRKA